MIKVSSIGKFLDQPLLTAKLNKQIPTILTLGSGIFLAKELKNTPKEDKNQKRDTNFNYFSNYINFCN